MQTIIDLISPLFTFLFLDYDGAGLETVGAVVKFAEVVVSQPLLMIPVAIMLVGLVVGIFGRIVGAIKAV